MLDRRSLRSALDTLEGDAEAGGSIAAGRLDALAEAAKYWAARAAEAARARAVTDSNASAPLRRLARICRRIGERERALALLEAVRAVDGERDWIAMTVTAIYAELQASVQPVTVAPTPAAAQPRPVPQATLLATQLGELTRAGHRDEAVALAREMLAAAATTTEFADPTLVFQCYTTLGEFSTDAAEIDRARDLVFRAAEADKRGLVWRARLHRRERRAADAVADYEAAVAYDPNDGSVHRELAWSVLSLGDWGRHAPALARALPHAPAGSPLHAAISEVDAMLRTFGGSLELAAAEPAAFAHVRSPESIAEQIAERTPPPNALDGRDGVVMIIGTLAAGGAERMLATSFRRIRHDARFGWAKLYAIDVSPETRKDFYLPLTGLAREEVVVLDRHGVARPPLSWLGAGRSSVTQSIFDNLERDKPAVVHAWLEPLDVLAGLAAILAGVPRVVLHTHNMYPGELDPHDPFVPAMRECYRAILRRPEVTLVCCADAVARDYAAWLGIADTGKFVTLHNGLDAEEVAGAGDPQTTAQLRAGKEHTKKNVVVGTAFRFSEVKRPLRWVEAAERVFRRHPECRFEMYGNGELHAATREAIRAMGLGPYFHLHGTVSDIFRHLPAMDLFVLSSRTEALPNVLLEAQAAGVPVIAYDVGGIAEALIDGVTGILVKELSRRAGRGDIPRRCRSRVAPARRRGRAGICQVRVQHGKDDRKSFRHPAGPGVAGTGGSVAAR